MADEPLNGMDQFIDDFARTVNEELPSKILEAAGADIHLQIDLPFHVDNELAEQIVRQLKDLSGVDNED